MLKVLIVDDDQLTLDCLKKFIHWEDIGCELADMAQNGAVAYDLAIEKDVDVIISDIKMPVVDGVELCQKLREGNHNVQIIFLSAYSDFHTAQLAMRYHVTDYILKPLSLETISSLENLLLRIRNERMKRNDYLSLINSAEFMEYARVAMKEESLLFYTSFFEEIKCDNDVDFNTVRLVCARLLDMIYDFVYSGTNVSYFAKKQNAMEQLMSHKNKEAAIDYVCNIYKSVFQLSDNEAKARHDSIVTSVEGYIHENYQYNYFGVSNVAKQYFFSVTHLNRIFKAATGMTVSEYIANLRMTKAVELLLHTELPINKIAEKVGYSSDTYFIRLFRSKYKGSPSEYRRSHLNEYTKRS